MAYRWRIKGDILLYAFALRFLRCLIKITPAPITAKINNDHASPRGDSLDLSASSSKPKSFSFILRLPLIPAGSLLLELGVLDVNGS